MTDDIMPPVSNSELKEWKRCHRKWYLSHYRQLRPLPQDRPLSNALTFGTKMHTALELYYAEDVNPIDTIENLFLQDLVNVRRFSEWYGVDTAEERAKLYKDRQLAHAMLSGYIEWLEETGADEDLELIAAESVVIVSSPVPGVKMRGKLDQRVQRRSDGAKMFLDHKPQPLTEPVLTPGGWRQMGDIEVGSSVIGEDGSTWSVLEVFDRGEDDVYDIALNDNTVLRATADHPWVAKDTKYGKWVQVATRDLKVGRHRILSYDPRRDEEDAVLPVDPYFLGSWIANGSHHASSVVDGEYRTIKECSEATGHTMYTKPTKAGKARTWHLGTKKDTTDKLIALGVGSCYSKDRFIPDVYIHKASWSQRLELLRGLMDGDGSLTTTRSSAYSTTSDRLAEDVVSLARSLGFWAKANKSERFNRVVDKVGGSYDTNTKTTSVAIVSDVNPFKNVGHAHEWERHRREVRGKKGTNSGDRIVRSVTKSGHEHVRCIRIDNPTSLYVTNGWCVTHNTLAGIDQAAKTLPMDEQMKFYTLLERLEAIEKVGYVPPDVARGALYNILKKVKRTARAKPPFYKRIEVGYNQLAVDNMLTRVQRVIEELVEARKGLDEGGDPHYWAYPNPTKDCSWDCPFVHVCPLMDEQPRETWEQMLEMQFEKHDPYERYNQ